MNGYFDGMLRFLEHSVEEGFVRREHLPIIAVGGMPEEVLNAFATYEPPRVAKWIDVAET